MMHTKFIQTTLTIALLSVLLVALLSPVAFADVFVTNQFYEATWDRSGALIKSTTPVTDVSALGFSCSDSACSNVGKQIFGAKSLNSASTSKLQIFFPTQAQYSGKNGYGVYYYKPGYLTWEQNYLASGTGTDSTIRTIYLTKMDMCRAVIDTFSVTNDVYPNQPIMVDIQTSLDSTVHSPIKHAGPLGYVPPQLVDHYQVDAKITVEILDENGAVLNTQEKNVAIDFSGSIRVQFDYTPNIAGKYTARVSAITTDAVCLNNEKHSSQKGFSVLDQGPVAMCYTLLNNLQVTPEYPKAGQSMQIAVEKITNYYDENANVFPLGTWLYVQAVKDGVEKYGGWHFVFSNANIMNSQPFTFDYIPTEEGYYTINVYSQAHLCPFNNETKDIATQTVYVEAGIVEPNNQAPIFFTLPNQALLTTQSSTVLFSVQNYVFDADGDSMTVNFVSQSNASVADCHLNSGGYIICDPHAIGKSTITLAVSDQKDQTQSSFIVSVHAPNVAPTLQNLPDVLLPTVGYYPKILDLSLYAHDDKNQPLTYNIVTQTDISTIDCQIESHQYISCTAKKNEGFSDIRISVSDGTHVDSDVMRLSMNGSQSTNRAPQATFPHQTLNRLGLHTGLFTVSDYASDADADPLTFRIAEQSDLSVVACQIYENRFDCTAKKNGMSMIAIAVSDGKTETISQFSVEVGINPLLMKNCTGPDGTTIAHAESKHYFLLPQTFGDQMCEALSQQRVCNDGKLSGSYAFATCNNLNDNANNLTVAIPDVTIEQNVVNFATLALPNYITQRTGSNEWNVSSYSVQLVEQSSLDIVSCQLNAQATLVCTTKANKIGPSTIRVKVTDGKNTVHDEFTVTVKRSSYTAPVKPSNSGRESLTINQFKLFDDALTGEIGSNEFIGTISLYNDGNKVLDDVRGFVSIPELGIRSTKFGSFDLVPNEQVNKHIYLSSDLPIQPGYYTVRLSVHTENGLTRIVHRDVYVDNKTTAVQRG